MKRKKWKCMPHQMSINYYGKSGYEIKILIINVPISHLKWRNLKLSKLFLDFKFTKN